MINALHLMQGLNTSKPYLRIGPHTFEARHENLIGSELLLEEKHGLFQFSQLCYFVYAGSSNYGQILRESFRYSLGP